MKNTKLTFIIVIVANLILLTGCPKTPPPPPPVEVVEVIKVGVMLDKSGSAKSTRTKQPTIEDIQPIINRIKQSGGELGVGLVTDNSNKSLVRLRVEVRPTLPVKPTSETFKGDADKFASAYKEYNQKKALYEENIVSWNQETEKRVQKFLSEVEQLLSLEPKAKRTDVMNALNRVDLFLAEKDPSFPVNAKKVIILNSDAQDNVKAKLNALNSGARLIVVNGIGSVGSLKDLKPELFESLEAAINQIVKGE